MDKRSDIKLEGVNFDETCKTIELLKSDERFAFDFLYGNSNLPGKSIRHIRTRILNQVKKTYGVFLDENTFNTIIYEHLWSEGTWKVLDSYNFKCSFFHWLSIVSAHCVMAFLEENGYIKVSRKRTPGNTCIRWKKKTPSYCQKVLDDMLHIKPLHTFLTALYVDRMKQDDIMRKFNINDEVYSITLKAAEKALKTAIINSDNPYEDFISDRNPRRLTLSSDFLLDFDKTNQSNTCHMPLREVLGIHPEDAAFEEKVVNFLLDFSNKLFIKEEDKYVWKARFIDNKAPVKVADELGRNRGWVDTRYNRLNKKFNAAIQHWWHNTAS